MCDRVGYECAWADKRALTHRSFQRACTPSANGACTPPQCACVACAMDFRAAPRQGINRSIAHPGNSITRPRLAVLARNENKTLSLYIYKCLCTNELGAAPLIARDHFATGSNALHTDRYDAGNRQAFCWGLPAAPREACGARRREARRRRGQQQARFALPARAHWRDASPRAALPRRRPQPGDRPPRRSRRRRGPRPGAPRLGAGHQRPPRPRAPRAGELQRARPHALRAQQRSFVITRHRATRPPAAPYTRRPRGRRPGVQASPAAPECSLVLPLGPHPRRHTRLR